MGGGIKGESKGGPSKGGGSKGRGSKVEKLRPESRRDTIKDEKGAWAWGSRGEKNKKMRMKRKSEFVD